MNDRGLQGAALAALLALPLLAGCAGGGTAQESGGDTAAEATPGKLTIYSGRNEKLIGPLLERFERASGVDVEVRYASTSELAATLMEEGERTPAELFIAQDAAALGALSAAGLLSEIPAATVERVAARYRSPRNDWVGLSGRARTVVYNPELISESDLPQRLSDAADPRYRGKFGLAPNNASFQAHMAAYGALNGEAALTELLTGLAANEPKVYPKNTPIVEAVIAGEIEWGFVNHYYLLRALAETPDAPGENFVMPTGDGSDFLNIAGAGLLRETEAALALLRFLLADEAQRYFREETFEYPLVAALDADGGSPGETSRVDFGEVSAMLETTLGLIRDSQLARFQ
jgi:iron(III) transport system substrate-binding protein